MECGEKKKKCTVIFSSLYGLFYYCKCIKSYEPKRKERMEIIAHSDINLCPYKEKFWRPESVKSFTCFWTCQHNQIIISPCIKGPTVGYIYKRGQKGSLIAAWVYCTYCTEEKEESLWYWQFRCLTKFAKSTSRYLPSASGQPVACIHFSNVSKSICRKFIHRMQPSYKVTTADSPSSKWRDLFFVQINVQVVLSYCSELNVKQQQIHCPSA